MLIRTRPAVDTGALRDVPPSVYSTASPAARQPCRGSIGRCRGQAGDKTATVKWGHRNSARRHAGAAACLLFTGPRMREQPTSGRIRPGCRRFRRRGAVEPARFCRGPEADALTMPCRDGREPGPRPGLTTVLLAFCHGPAGAGDGPVGRAIPPSRMTSGRRRSGHTRRGSSAGHADGHWPRAGPGAGRSPGTAVSLLYAHSLSAGNCAGRAADEALTRCRRL